MIDRHELDRHITGNYGEDYFKHHQPCGRPNALIRLAKWWDWGYMSVEHKPWGNVVELPWRAANVLARLRREKTLHRKRMQRRRLARACWPSNELEGVAVVHGALSAYELHKTITAWRNERRVDYR